MPAKYQRRLSTVLRELRACHDGREEFRGLTFARALERMTFFDFAWLVNALGRDKKRRKDLDLAFLNGVKTALYRVEVDDPIHGRRRHLNADEKTRVARGLGLRLRDLLRVK